MIVASDLVWLTSSLNHAINGAPCSGRVILRHVKDRSSLLRRCRLEPNPHNIGQFARPAILVKYDWCSICKQTNKQTRVLKEVICHFLPDSDWALGHKHEKFWIFYPVLQLACVLERNYLNMYMKPQSSHTTVCCYCCCSCSTVTPGRPGPPTLGIRQLVHFTMSCVWPGHWVNEMNYVNRAMNTCRPSPAACRWC